MTAWALLVVSSDKQTESLANQRAWAEEVCAKYGWRLDRIFSDASSGKLGTRRLVKDLIAALHATPADARPKRLLMIRLDRLGRGDDGGVDTLQAYKEIIRDLKVTIHTREDGDLSFGRVTDLVAPFMRLFVGAFENENRIDKSREVYKRKRAAGLPIGNKRPYGLTIGPDGQDHAKEPEAEGVRLAFRLRLEGMGTHAIAGQLTLYAPPKVFKRGHVRKIPWSCARVRILLKNRAYVGPIVDEATYQQAQRVPQELGRIVTDSRARHPWPLAGALRCFCGYNLKGQATGAGKYFRYYVCRATWNHAGSYRYNRAEPIEEQFVALLKRLAASPALISQYRRTNTAASPALIERNLRSAKADLADVNRKRDRVWEMNDKGLIPDEDMRERLEALAEQRAEITARIGTLEGESAAAQAMERTEGTAAESLQLAAAIYETASLEEQRRIAKAVALLLGGLCVEEDRMLAVRAPRPPGKRQQAP